MKPTKLILQIILAVAVMLSFASCSKDGNFKKSKTKKSFVSLYENQSLEESKKQLKQDLADVDSLLDIADGYSMYFGISFSVGPAVADSTKHVETKEAIPLNIDVDETTAKADFDSIFMYDGQPNKTYLQQEFKLPNSTVEPHISASDAKGAEVTASLKTIYYKGKPVAQNKIGLKRIDSAAIQVNYKYPASMERFEFPYTKQDSVVIAGQTIEIDDPELNGAEYYFPQELYQRLIGFQAYDESEKLMDATGNSAFPVMTVRKSISDNFKKTKNALLAAQKSTSQQQLVAALNKIPDNTFKEKQRLYELDERYTKEKKAKKHKKSKKENDDFDDELAAIKKLMADFDDILAPEQQLVEVSFPNRISRMIFYFGKDYRQITKTGVAVSERGNDYATFFDEEKKKYGIMDSLGNIIIKPVHDEPIYYLGNRAFRNTDKNYLLDVKAKKLIDYGDKFLEDGEDPRFAVFSDSTKKKGVMDYSKKVIIPFEYSDIEILKNTFVASKDLRGRTFKEILDLKGKSITGRIAEAEKIGDTGNVIVTTMDETYGIMNGDGKYVLKPQFNSLSSVDNGFVIFTTNSTNSQPMDGLMDSNGKILSEARAYSIYKASKNMMSVRTIDDGEYRIVDYNGNTAIPGKFEKVKALTEDYALISHYIKVDDRNREVFEIVNRAGKVVADIPWYYEDFIAVRKKGSETVFEFEYGDLSSKNLK